MSKIRQSKFFHEIKDSKIEKEVESVYKKGIERYFEGAKIRYPYGCDGYVEYKLYINEKNKDKILYNQVSKILRLIMEFKYDENLNSKINKSKVLIQVLYYLKYFELNGQILPSVVLVGDKNNTFVIHTNDIAKYLSEDIDWSIAPSVAPTRNPELLLEITKDSSINPFLFSINNTFSFKDVADKIKDLALNVQRYVRITEHNIAVIYDYFINRVIKDISKIDANRLVYIFINLMIRPNDVYLHPNKKNTLIIADGDTIQVNGDSYKAFVSHFERNYKPREKEVFTSISDRLIEDTIRRFKGEFYTPTTWVDEAHLMISKQLGENWKEDYVVWDCAWGTGNLTRDYRFKKLYCSTLNDSDLDIGRKYNVEASKFQYDFLNDDIELISGQELLKDYYKLPVDLLKVLLEDKPILFFINPPYATANNAGTKEGDHKEGVAQTKMNTIMKNEHMGYASQQLYAQFLYKILKIKQTFNLTNINIAVFSPTLYLTIGGFKGFRKLFLEEFNFTEAMLFNAKNFNDCKESWGIGFSIWKTGKCIDKNNFIHEVKMLDSNNNIIKTMNKNIYNLDDREETCSDWIKKEVIRMKTKDAPQMSSAIKIKQKGRGKLVDGALGYYVNVGNSIYKNNTDVYLLSSAGSTANGISIIPENFKKVCSNFASRKLITGKYNNWINQKDEYVVPNINNEEYLEFENDSIIYSLFNTASNQSSLRKIMYSNKIWNIKNEFFFMSVEEIKELANENENDDIYEDIRAYGNERYVFKLLEEINLSNEAKAVLDKAIELTINSFKYRELFNEEKPEYQINTWDAGWYQIKALLNEYMKNEYQEFLKLYRKLEDRMRPMVYELEFLKGSIELYSEKEIETLEESQGERVLQTMLL